MDQVLATGTCAAVVSKWLKQHKRTQHLTTSASADAAFIPRAERLGLGAKFVSHAQATLSTEEQKFQRKLQKPTTTVRIAPSGQQSCPKKSKRMAKGDDDDADESRTSAFSRPREQRKRKRG
uniref:Uncharacterized protein n=1 Tax=Haptolina brevifila TaxID=156173 RepID=A0A7S2IFM4_9EUKA